MKNLKVLSGFTLVALLSMFIFTSCGKEDLTVDESLTDLQVFETAGIDQLTEEFDLKTIEVDAADFIEIEEAPEGVEERKGCCDVGQIVNLAGGTNRFRIKFRYNAGDAFILTVWQGSSFQSSGLISAPFNSCTTSYHLTDLDAFANIQPGQSYTLRVFLYKPSGPYCDLGTLNFIGE